MTLLHKSLTLGRVSDFQVKAAETCPRRAVAGLPAFPEEKAALTCP